MSSVAAPPRTRQVTVPVVPWKGVGIGFAVALVLCLTAFAAAGGTRVQSTAPIELGLTAIGAALCAAAIVRGSGPLKLYGGFAFLALALLAGFTAISIAWSVEPSDSWLETNRTLSYLATFAGGIALVRLVPGHWNALLGGVLGAGAIICLYALLTKVLPGSLDPDAVIPRLRSPFDYWNAIGLVAAMTVPLALWLGARRSGHQALNALAYPITMLALVTMLLAYSRGAIVAAGIGCILWFAVVPLRLRSIVVLLTGAVGSTLVVLWALGQDGLTMNRLPVGLRNETGTELGVLLLIVGLLLLVVGMGLSFWMDLVKLSGKARKRTGLVVLVLAVLAVIGGGVAVASSSGGVSGTVKSLVDPNAPIPDNSAGRLTSAGSVRARYYRDALRIFEDNVWLGAGAGSYETIRARYRQDRATVRHAHGYVAQTIADLGVVGLLLSLLAAGAFAPAALRTLGVRLGWGVLWKGMSPSSEPKPKGGARWPAERVGMVALASLVLTFGVHSLVDWTWFVPGCAVIALVAAGWLAGRGPLDAPLRGVQHGRKWVRWAIAARVLLAGLIVCYAIWQPWRSVEADDSAITALEQGRPRGALADARRAKDANPLAVEPLFTESKVLQTDNQNVQAKRLLEQAVQLQPSNPETWRRLAGFVLTVEKNAKEAVPLARAALYLDPRSPTARGLFLLALRGGPPGRRRLSDEASAHDPAWRGPAVSRRAAAVAAAMALAALALPGAASAGSDMDSMFQDDSLLVYGTPAEVSNALDTMKALGTDRVRVSVFWRLVAPDPEADKRPPIRNGNIGPASPEWYGEDKWARYDTLVRLAAAKGIAVNFNLTTPAPNWATQGDPPRADLRDVNKPDAEEFGRFVNAVGFRYSGSYTPPPAAAPPQQAPPDNPPSTPVIPQLPSAKSAQNSPLPRVSFWSIWNEPNQGGWLAPQWTDGVETSPRLYRSLVDGAYAGLVATGHGPDKDTVLVGELAPKGSDQRNPTAAMKPMIFLRALYCVDERLAPLRGARAQQLGCPEDGAGGPAFAQAHPGLFAATGIGHHPYNFPLAPNRKSRDPNFAALADMPRFERTVDRIFALYGAGRRGGVPIWYTEYGYQTKPPDPLGISWAKQAEYLDQTEYMAARDKRVRSTSQFLLVDDKPLSQFERDTVQYWGTFQTGLIELDGRRKTAFESYKLPVWLPSRGQVWGMVRAADNGATPSVRIETASKAGAKWKRRKSVRATGPRGVFRARVRLPRKGMLRVVARVGSSSVVSRTVNLRTRR